MSVFKVYSHAHQQQRLHHCLCHPSALHHAAAVYLRRLELTCFDAPSRLFGPTTQLSRLLSTPVTTFTNRLLVTERPPPAGADSGDCTCFRLDSKTKRVKEQQAAAALHCYDKYCSNSITTGTAHPRQLVVIAQQNGRLITYRPHW